MALFVISALVISLISFGLVSANLGTRSADLSPSPTSTVCPVASPGPSGATGAQGEPGLSAYDLWLAMGNTGTVENFLSSLIGKPGPKGADGKVVYYGSDGVTGAQGATGSTGATGATGAQGTPGKSAYQLWLEAGNTGTENDFLVSLIGPAGAQGPAGAAGAEGQAGVAGLSAYEVWLSNGNTGSEEDFFNSLAGIPGTNGTDGLPGLSAYEIWVSNGNTGTEGEFLASLVGPQGVEGAPGVCTVGETGATGAAGASAYEVWLAAGNVGSEAVFLASLVGSTGATGATGATGPQGEPGITTLGDHGSFYDSQTQTHTLINTAKPMRLNTTVIDATSGITIENDLNGVPTKITAAKTGTYDIQFSAQLIRNSGNNTVVAEIWLSKMGIPEPFTNTQITLTGSDASAKYVAAWNFLIDLNAGESVQLMWSVTDVDLIMPAITSGLIGPSVPSLIVTVNQVGGVAPQ